MSQPVEETGTRIALRRTALVAGCALLFLLSGCQGPNHFYAENSIWGDRLPDGLRVMPSTNTKTINLSRLASSSTGSEVIGVGDVLEVKIAAGLGEDDQAVLPGRVQNDGTIPLPDIGVIPVAGLEPQGAESMIRAEAIRKQLYLNPTVTVVVTEKKMNRVRVLGAVKLPGTYELPPSSSDIVSAIAMAQGLEDNAGQHVEVRNPVSPGSQNRPSVVAAGSDAINTVSASTESAGDGQMNSYTVDLISAARSGDGQFLVQDGGVVMVEERDPAKISIQGLVRAPNQYDFPLGQDLKILDAIALAQGMSNQLANKIYVVRQVAGASNPAVIEVSFRQAKRSQDSNILLQPGDVVSVEQTPGTVLMEALNIIRFGISGTTPLL
jgi:polysaccharide biosynthesis/export protein